MPKKVVFLVGSFLFVLAIAVATGIGGNWECIKSYFIHDEDACQAKPSCYNGKNPLKLTWGSLKGGCETKSPQTYALSYFTSPGSKNTASKCSGSSKTDCGWKCDLYDKKNRAINKVCTWPVAKRVCSGEPIRKQLKELAVKSFVYLKELAIKIATWVCSIPCLNFLCSGGSSCVQSPSCNVRETTFGKNIGQYRQPMQREVKGSFCSCPLQSSFCSGVPIWKRAKEITTKVLCFIKMTISRAVSSLYSWLKMSMCHRNDLSGMECVKMTADNLKKNITDVICKRRDVFPIDPPKKVPKDPTVAKTPCPNQLASVNRRLKKCPYCGCGMNPNLCSKTWKKRPIASCKQPFFVRIATYVLATLSALLLHLTVLPLLSVRPEN